MVSFHATHHFVPYFFRQKVASALLIHGRISLPQYVRFTRLKSRTVGASIIVLVQHHVLWHARSEDQGEMLKFNTRLACLLRLRFGRDMWQSESMFG